jgi:hypothetical protein
VEAKKGEAMDYRNMWDSNKIYDELRTRCRRQGLSEQRRQRYSNFRKGRSTVRIQYHKLGSEHVMIIGNPSESCPNPSRETHEFEALSGYYGKNKRWLKANDKTFQHMHVPRGFILPATLSDAEGWSDIKQLIEYAANREQ